MGKGMTQDKQSIDLYAIRLRGTDYYLSDRHNTFCIFEVAATNGLCFNTRKSAEKRIKEIEKNLRNTDISRAVYTRFVTYDSEDNPQYYSTNREFIDSQDYEINYMHSVSLDVVPLTLSIDS